MGMFWGWITLIDKAYMHERYGDDPDHDVPNAFVTPNICPTSPVGAGCDTGAGDAGFTRDF